MNIGVLEIKKKVVLLAIATILIVACMDPADIIALESPEVAWVIDSTWTLPGYKVQLYEARVAYLNLKGPGEPTIYVGHLEIDTSKSKSCIVSWKFQGQDYYQRIDYQDYSFFDDSLSIFMMDVISGQVVDFFLRIVIYIPKIDLRNRY